jgi:hypothetical protein
LFIPEMSQNPPLSSHKPSRSLLFSQVQRRRVKHVYTHHHCPVHSPVKFWIKIYIIIYIQNIRISILLLL